MMSQPLVMVVDDDAGFRQMVQMVLEGEGYDVLLVDDPLAALQLAYEARPSAILLDVTMPHMDGFAVCERLREVTDAPIIFTTARGAVEDVVHGLSAGADGYLVKPFRVEVLISRLRACLRRSGPQPSMDVTLLFPSESLILDCGRHVLQIDGRDVLLTPREFEVLRVLIQHMGQVMGVDAILAHVACAKELRPDSVKQYIYRLRKKIELDSSSPRYLHTVWGAGYYFDPGD